jgi:cell wall-associated NlpC family hydrolase
LGDLIFFDWKGGGVDHVDMWMGGGMLIGHGGPDNGPDTYSCAPRISAAVKYWVRRHI